MNSSNSVWILDDDRSIRWVLEKSLEQANIPCRVFDSAETIIRLLTKEKPAAIKKLDGMKVLLVEDNRMNIIVTKKLLTVWKVKVEVAVNGLIGVEKAAENDYDLILMDLQMPVMDGFEATRNIRLNPKHHSTPIIALTAEVMEESQQRAEEAGMNDFVTKPFNPNVLYQAMAQYAKVES